MLNPGVTLESHLSVLFAHAEFEVELVVESVESPESLLVCVHSAGFCTPNIPCHISEFAGGSDAVMVDQTENVQHYLNLQIAHDTMRFICAHVISHLSFDALNRINDHGHAS